MPCHTALAPVTLFVIAMSEATGMSAEIWAKAESRASESSSARDSSSATAPFNSRRTSPRRWPRRPDVSVPSCACTMTRIRSPARPGLSRSPDRLGPPWPEGTAGHPVSAQSRITRNTNGRRMDTPGARRSLRHRTGHIAEQSTEGKKQSLNDPGRTTPEPPRSKALDRSVRGSHFCVCAVLRLRRNGFAMTERGKRRGARQLAGACPGSAHPDPR